MDTQWNISYSDVEYYRFGNFRESEREIFVFPELHYPFFRPYETRSLELTKYLGVISEMGISGNYSSQEEVMVVHMIPSGIEEPSSSIIPVLTITADNYKINGAVFWRDQYWAPVKPLNRLPDSLVIKKLLGLKIDLEGFFEIPNPDGSTDLFLMSAKRFLEMLIEAKNS